MREAINIAISLIWKLSVVAELAVAARLLTQGLGGEYPALLAACCILPIKSLLLMAAAYSSSVTHSITHQQATAVWGYLQPFEWAVSSWLVFELFARWTRSYIGIGRFGKFLLAGLLVIALIISDAFWKADWEALVFAQSARIFYIINRIVWVTLALFVVGTWLFFRNYPVAIAPNVLRHTHIAVVYFVVNALSEWTFTLNGLYGPKVVAPINLSIVLTTTTCFGAWAILLTRKGQVTPPLQRVSQEDRNRIEKINEELLVFMGSVPKHDR